METESLRPKDASRITPNIESSQKASSDTKNSLPELKLFTDFRQYLQSFYDFKRQEKMGTVSGYNYSMFSAAADIKSPNYLKLIILGQRNLSGEMIKKFSKALQHTKEQAKEFQVLVEYGQAKVPSERNQGLKKLSELRLQQQLKDIPGRKNSPSWLTWALYAMLDQKNMTSDRETLKDLLLGRASSEDIEKALQALITTGEVKQDGVTGELTKGSPLGESLGGLPGTFVRKLQSEFIYLGLESLLQDQPGDREIGALTIALTEKEFEDLKFEMRHFRKRLHKRFSVERDEVKGDRVFQLNIQLFPLSKPNESPVTEDKQL